MVVGGLAVIAAALYVEARVAAEPIIPLRLFKDRTTSLATAASVLIGVSMFGATVYLSEYFQNARGMSPTEAGLMSVAMVGGLLVSSIVTGRIISDTGLWKRYLVGGMVLVVVGLALLGTIDATTPLVEVGAFMARARPRARRHDAEPRPRGPEQHRPGRHGCGQLGRLVLPLDGRLDRRLRAGRAAQPPGHPEGHRRAGARSASSGGHSTGSIPDLDALPAPVRALYEGAFGEATGHLFLVAAPFALLAFVCILFIREVPLRTTLDREPSASMRSVIGNNDRVQARGRVEAGVR